MTRYRNRLPQLDGGLFVTDGGVETYLIFHHGFELSYGEAYTLLASETGIDRIHRYFDDFVDIADQHRMGLVLESVTWRANPDWAAKVGTSRDALAAANRTAVGMLAAIRERRSADAPPTVVSGCIGPRSDAYRPTEIMSPDEAQEYHAFQVGIFHDTEADMVSAMTLTNVPEAIGIARAARAAGMPVALSFTVETDGRLPTGTTLRDAIDEVDAATDASPAYYMINCAHPTHFGPALEADQRWTRRIRALRANASCKSHAELNDSLTLDEGDPTELGRQYREILARFPHINVLGGCCGTDHRHIRAIAAACAAAPR